MHAPLHTSRRLTFLAIALTAGLLVMPGEAGGASPGGAARVPDGGVTAVAPVTEIVGGVEISPPGKYSFLVALVTSGSAFQFWGGH